MLCHDGPSAVCTARRTVVQDGSNFIWKFSLDPFIVLKHTKLLVTVGVAEVDVDEG